MVDKIQTLIPTGTSGVLLGILCFQSYYPTERHWFLYYDNKRIEGLSWIQVKQLASGDFMESYEHFDNTFFNLYGGVC